jgi:phosphatidylserine/phosphatidylglycerophosphate/cardiolipin synthase-like enzyme
MAQKTPSALEHHNTTLEPASDKDWWARGDLDVGIAEALAPLVDGRAAMLAMCVAFLTAKQHIWLADWSLHAKLRMVRGHDHRAGKDGTPEQHALIERLRAAGLDDEAIALWESSELRVVDVLGFAARRGVQARVLLWGPYNPGGFFHLVGDPDEQQRLLRAQGVDCRLDKSNRSPLHLAQALHQKCAAVDGRIAFVGGIDLAVQHSGDFDRWDTPSHPFESQIRSTDLGLSPHPWHDAHLLLTGTPAADVEHNIRQRWDEAMLSWWRKLTPPLKHLAQHYMPAQQQRRQEHRERQEANELRGAGPELSGAAARVQVVRTIPALTYRFAPAGINTIAEAYINAIHQARRFIYLESQYLWLEGLPSLTTPGLGWESRYMRALFAELVEAAGRGVTIALVLPDHPNVGRAVTDNTIARLRQRAPEAAAEGRLRFFCLAASAPHAEKEMMRYRPVYVHAKVGIVDDRWATVGSANLNSRGMSHDAELNLAVLDEAFSRGLRLSLWAEHLGALRHAHAGWPQPACIPLPNPLREPETDGLLSLIQPTESWLHPARSSKKRAVKADGVDLSALEDPIAGIDFLARHAAENLERLRQGQALVGQLLPYLHHAEGKALGLAVDRRRGLLDPMRGVREGVRVRHHNRYM